MATQGSMMNGFAFEFDSATSAFSKREYRVPVSLKPGEILVRMTCCTICGSDLHTYCGRRKAPAGCVLGHEIIGTLEAWGDRHSIRDFNGQPLALGDRVTWTMAVGCGDCFYCNQRLSQKCTNLFKYGHQSPSGQVPSGGLSEFCQLVPGTDVFRIPDSIPDEVACPANCATATVSAAIRLVAETHSIPGSSALVIGAGMLGLTAAAQLNDAGASQIVVADLEPERLKRATLFGATDWIESADSKAWASAHASTGDGRGFDLVLDFAGTLGAVQQALDQVRVGGCVLLAGSVFSIDDLCLSPESIVRRMLTIRGLHNYLATDLAEGLKFLERAQNRFPFAELVSHQYPLAMAPEAFEQARSHQAIRVAIRREG